MKKRYTTLILVVIFALFLSACNGTTSPATTGAEEIENEQPETNTDADSAETADAPEEDETEGEEDPAVDSTRDIIRIALVANPTTLDPYNTTDSPASRVNVNIHETLVKRDADMNLIPGLAESWEIVDETTYRFKIREGVKFHNGEELKASDVKFSFDMQKDNPHADSVTGMVDFDQCKAIDEYTFEMKMESPFGPILQHLTHAVTSIVNEKAYKEAGDDYGQNPVGTGPYKFVEWKADDYVELTRHDDYWGEKALVKDLLFRIIPESSTRTIEVESGGVDIATRVAPSEVARFEDSDKVIVNLSETFSTNFFAFNTTVAPFDDARVRQAINYAINKEAILKVVYQDIGLVGSAPISPTVWGYHDSLEPFGYNPDKARELLAEAGKDGGFTLTITTDEDQVRRDVAEMIQAQLAEVGITVEIEPLERGAFIGKVIDGGLESFILGWSTFGDPDYALYASFHSSMHGAGGNMSRYTNAEVDELLQKARVSVDDAERLELYKQAQEIIWSESPCVFLQHDTEATLYSKDLKGFNISPEGYSDFSKMHF